MAMIVEHVQRNFTDSEVLEFGKQAAQLHEQVRQLLDEKKTANDHFKDEITSRETEISGLSTKITLGYEIIPTPCDIVLNQPTKGMKQYVCQKTMEIIKTIPMTEADRQSGLFGADERGE